MLGNDKSDPKVRRRISTLLFVILAGIAAVVVLGLVVMSVRLFEIQHNLGRLHDNALPRLVKLAQLSQEASATSSVAPALSMNPTMSEFDTLLSRLKDKESSQRSLTEELAELFEDPEDISALRHNGVLLMTNLQNLTEVVRDQIAVNRRLDEHRNQLRRLVELLAPENKQDATTERSAPDDESPAGPAISALATAAMLQIEVTLLDPNRAHFSRNTHETDANMQALVRTLEASPAKSPGQPREQMAAVRQFVQLWSSSRDMILGDKDAELANAFRIKALAEENSLIANRLLSSASNEFWRASDELETQIRHVDGTIRFTLLSIIVVFVAFGAGNFLVWYVLKRRVFERLDRMRQSLRVYAEHRRHAVIDPVRDEIGEISGSLAHYMGVIDQRETELADKTSVMEKLSSQLAKYLSPQVYDSIFTGKQEVKVASSRKKLTIFFSDIADFTETADRLESEELTQLLNEYLTEMSRIALDHGATIDKYVGDGIMIFFGDPETRGVRQDALACVRMAITMRQRMRELEDSWRRAGIEKPLRVRMGIHTGYCTVGNFGSEDRMDYTIIGGAVNIASRLETLAAPGEIVISYETFAHASQEVRCTEHGKIEVKGIAYPITAYQVVDTYENLAGERHRLCEQHAHLQLDLDRDAMTTEERKSAETILVHALRLIRAPDEGMQRTGSEKNLPKVSNS